MPDACLPEHLKGKKHDDWLWPFSEIPRGWTAFCGAGPVWQSEHQKPVPLPGHSSFHEYDKTGAWRPYYARTWGFDFFGLGYLHFRIGFRWDDGEAVEEQYYNFVPFNLGFEYQEGA